MGPIVFAVPNDREYSLLFVFRGMTTRDECIFARNKHLSLKRTRLSIQLAFPYIYWELNITFRASDGLICCFPNGDKPASLSLQVVLQTTLNFLNRLLARSASIGYYRYSRTSCDPRH